MTVIFPAMPTPVIAMAVTMEAAKLVTAGWLARRWRVTALICRLVLVVLVVGLAVINATGVYAQFVAAHVGERGAATSAVETQDAALAARIDVAAHNVADLDRRLGQIDAAVEKATEKGRTAAAMKLAEDQRKTRGELAAEPVREGKALATLQVEKASVDGERRKVEADLGPVRYLAMLLGADRESALRWFILVVAMLLDPAAVLLLLTATRAAPL
jgi:hypothetical protein